jgi:transposase
MNKKEIAGMFGWSYNTLVKWMKTIPELQNLIKRKGSGTYLYTEAEIKLIIEKYKGKKDS